MSEIGICESSDIMEEENDKLTSDQINQIVSTDAGFDNEWVRFMHELAKNKSLQDIVNYIESVHWSRRQRKTIMSYARIILGDIFSTTNFINPHDFRLLQDDKALVDCDLTIGLTRFDLSPEWNILINMINIHFGAAARMSKGGWFVERIGAQKHEIYQEERLRERTGYKEKISNVLGFGE